MYSLLPYSGTTVNSRHTGHINLYGRDRKKSGMRIPVTYINPCSHTNTVIPVYNEPKNLYGGDKKIFVITRDSLYISLFTYKLSLFDFARLFVITFGNVCSSL